MSSGGVLQLLVYNAKGSDVASAISHVNLDLEELLQLAAQQQRDVLFDFRGFNFSAMSGKC
jgi:hypothetical protein